MINYVRGDATRPQGEGLKLIIHCCNNEGKWGKGFVLALSKRWDYPEYSYKKWFEKSYGYAGTRFALGKVMFVEVEPDIVVANMIGQQGTKKIGGVPPIRYDAIRECLISVMAWCLKRNASVHCPRFGAGLAGGEWQHIESLLEEYVCRHGVDVTVYDL